MKIVNIHEAKTQLSRLLKQVSNGEEIVIGKSGKPIVRLIAYDEKQKPRSPGFWKGKVKINEDFDELPEKLVNSFYKDDL